MKDYHLFFAFCTLMLFSCNQKNIENVSNDSLAVVAIDSTAITALPLDTNSSTTEPEKATSEASYEGDKQFDFTFEGLINNKIKVRINMFKYRDVLNARGVYLSTKKIINMGLRNERAGNFELTEKINGKVTGIWKLAISEEDILTGTWSSPDGKNIMPITLSRIEDSFDSFLTPSEVKSGFYELVYLNDDPETKEEFPILNSEELYIKNMAGNSLYFDLYIQGSPPGVHIGMANGMANKVGNAYVYKNEDGCEITMLFADNKVTLSQNGSDMNCEFGAGIGAYGTLTKK